MNSPLDRAPLRQQMPVSQKWAYFEHAAVGPLSGPAQQVLLDWTHEITTEGDTLWPQWAADVARTRSTAAELIGAETKEIAFVPNTTTGIGLVAEGYPWQQGDNAVILADEYPANQYPWINLASRGVECRRVPVEAGRVDLDRLAAACDDRTRIVSASWVGFASGWRIDPGAAARVAHDKGALFFLDAIQGLGVFPLDVKACDIDFLAADGHKWMLSPEGAGILYLKQAHLSLLRPLMVGAASVKDHYNYGHIDYTLKANASRYEGGSLNMVGLMAMGASLRMLMEWGVSKEDSRVAEAVLEITDLACQRLEEIGCEMFTQREGDHRSGIVSFTLPGHDPGEVRKHCLEQGVALSARVGRLRIAPHAYSNEEDIDRLISVLRSV